MPIQQLLLGSGVAALSLAASPVAVNLTDVQGSTQSQAVAITVTGGVAPYTYSTVWASGGTLIQIIGPMSSTYGVSGTSAIIRTRTGVARTTVTDSLNNTAHIDVPVSIEWV